MNSEETDFEPTAYREYDGAPVIPINPRANAEQRLLCMILIDCSGSMSIDDKMSQVNDGLRQLEMELKNDPLASVRVSVAVIAFGTPQGVEIIQEWTDAINFIAPQFEPSSATPMGRAVEEGLQLIDDGLEILRDEGVMLFKPWLFLFTDGQPTDDYRKAAAECAERVRRKQILFWPITTDPESAEHLQAFAGPGKPVFAIDSTDVRELFVWLSSSMKSASGSRPDEKVQLEAPGRILTVEL